MIIQEQELIKKKYKKESIYYLKNITKDKLDELIKKFFSYPEKDTTKRNEYKNFLFKDVEAYRKYKTGYTHVKMFNPKRNKKADGSYSYSFESDTTSNTNSLTKERRIKNYKNNLEILRYYQNGDNTPLLFKVSDKTINMEQTKVSILKEDNIFSTNFDLHHIVTINNHSRDKVDIDPNKWLIMVDLTSYKKIEVDTIIMDDILIINDKEYNKDNIKLEIIDDELIAYHKSDSVLERIKELISIMIIPIDEHGIFHKHNGRTKIKNIGYSDYNIDALPYSLRKKENYDKFLDILSNKFKFNRKIFKDFDDHIKYLEV